MPFKDEAHLVTAGDRFKTITPLVYEGKHETFRVPDSVFTDLASVPSPLQWFAPSAGVYTRAAILHDWTCELAGHGAISSRDSDGIFRRVLREAGVPRVKRWLMWAGVRWGSIFSRSRRADVGKDLPMLALMTLLGVVLVLPAAAVAAAFWLLYYVIEGMLGWVTEPLGWDV